MATQPSSESDRRATTGSESADTDANAPGVLMISTLPWSRVFVDGVDSGRDTPVRSLEVTPGLHTVGLKTPDGEMHTVEVRVDPGQQVRIIRHF